MRRTDTIFKITSILIFLTFAFYLAYYAFVATKREYTLVQAEDFLLQESLDISGLIVRDELVLTSDGNFCLEFCENCCYVAKNELIAQSFLGEEGLARGMEIRDLEEKRRYILNNLYLEEKTLLLKDRAIKEEILALNKAVLKEKTYDISYASLGLSSLIFENAGAYVSVAELNGIENKLEKMKAEAMEDSLLIYAKESGIFSLKLDGYEHISPNDIEGISPSDFEKLVENPKGLSENAFGKIQTGFDYFYIANISAENYDKIKDNKKLYLSFEACTEPYLGDIIYASQEQEGKICLAFRLTKGKSELAEERAINASLELKSISGIKIPKEAVYSDEKGDFAFVLWGKEYKKVYIELIYEENEFFLAENSRGENDLKIGDEIILFEKS